jgi:HNH endonuclease
MSRSTGTSDALTGFYFVVHWLSMPRTYTRIPIEQRFWKHVEVKAPTECWLWRGYKAKGYGQLMLPDRRWLKVHRFSWELATGKSADGFCVLHHCDTPLCVNPAHLYRGTFADNARDRRDRRRGIEFRQNGENNASAKLSDSDVRTIRHMHQSGRYSQKSIAELFGVSQMSVSLIVRRKLWKHLPSESK